MKKDNDALKHELALETRSVVKMNSSAQAEKVAKLQDEADLYTRKIELERRRIAELDKQTGIMQTKILEQRKRLERRTEPAREESRDVHRVPRRDVHRVPRPKLGVRALTRAFFERTHTTDIDELEDDEDDPPRPFCIIWPDSNFRDFAETSTTATAPSFSFAPVSPRRRPAEHSLARTRRERQGLDGIWASSF